MAIINKDTLYADYLIDKAHENASNVLTYSINKDAKADLTVDNISTTKKVLNYQLPTKIIKVKFIDSILLVKEWFLTH